MNGVLQAIAKASPRERAGLAVLAALAAITLAVYAWDWAGNTATRADETAQAAADADAVQASLGDASFRQALAARANDVQSWSRTGGAFEREEMLAELEGLTAQAGLNDASVALLEETESTGRVHAVNASISADFEWASFQALLEAFETNELSFAVTSVDVSEEGGAPRLNVLVTAPLIAAEQRL